MTGILFLAYMALGYNIFWRGLHDDLAHIPSVTVMRAIQAFTYGPALVTVLAAYGWVQMRHHNYKVWLYAITRDAAVRERRGEE